MRAFAEAQAMHGRFALQHTKVRRNKSARIDMRGRCRRPAHDIVPDVGGHGAGGGPAPPIATRSFKFDRMISISFAMNVTNLGPVTELEHAMYELPLVDGRRVIIFARHVASVERLDVGKCVVALDNNQQFKAAADVDEVTKTLSDLMRVDVRTP
ncbi:MAG TPA: hypothetical protein VH414_13935 [Lichenihabitans sp.]|nr:hypothetical protein [Lichenihabitans sp.]